MNDRKVSVDYIIQIHLKSNAHDFMSVHTRIVVTIRVLLAIESVTFVDESLLISDKLRPVWEFHTPICNK